MRDLVFSVTWQRNFEPVGTRIDALARWLGTAIGRRVVPKVSLSYEELMDSIRTKSVDIAWLPPIVRYTLERDGHVKSLLSSERTDRTLFHSVLVCGSKAKIESLDKLEAVRAAWVDPWSASGYVMPRLFMHEAKIDPARAFESEKFMGSHDAAVRRVLGGYADITATYANLDADGHIVSAGWKSIPEAMGKLRLLTVVGVIPADSIATRAELEEADAIADALVRGLEDPIGKRIIQEALDVAGFRKPEPDEMLVRSLERARKANLFPHIWEKK